MRAVGVILFVALAVTLVFGAEAVCCPDEDGCDISCTCLCCGSHKLFVNTPLSADVVTDSAPVSTGPCLRFASPHLSPDFPPPRF